MFSITKSNIARYTLVAGFALAMVSCKKDEEPEPRIGSIAGNVNPEATESVRVMNVNNQVLYTVTPAANGRFTFGHLNAGDYTVKVTPKPGYGIPAAIKVPVIGNETTDLGDIDVERNAFATFKVNMPSGNVTIADSGSIMADYSYSDSTLTFTTLPVRINGEEQRIMFNLRKFVGPATFSFTTNSGTSSAFFTSGSTNYTSKAGTGSVIITSYDAANQLISGTFNFTATNPNSTDNPDKIISEGSFRDVYVDMD